MPGANAPLTALQLSALPGDGFAFLGFLPQKTKARQEKLNAFRQSPLSIILFESANRVEETIADIEAILGPRPIALARELTKMFEEVIRGTTTEVLQKLKTHSNVKGEMVLVISGAEDTTLNSADIETLMLNALKEMKIKDAAKYVAEITGRPKSEVYDLALQLKNRTDA
jgi:16S rRNA (cytidine1402-2'-O)-methyltransferase